MSIKNTPISDSRGMRGSKVIQSGKTPREGWADAFKQMTAAGDDRLVDKEVPTGTRFDEEGWQW